MEIPYAADPFSHLTPGLAPGCFYTVGGTRNRETGWLQNCLLIIDFERASCEVLAQDTFLLQIKPEEDGVYFLNADKEIRKISQCSVGTGRNFFVPFFLPESALCHVRKRVSLDFFCPARYH